MRMCALLLLLAGAAMAQAQGDPTSALINEALDKRVDLKLEGILPDVLKKIDDATSVTVQVADPVYDLLPWGEQTKITATIKNQTLRSALTAIAHKLGLTWELGPHEVWLRPMPALVRLGRRATISEIESLDLLSNTDLTNHAEKLTVQALVDLIDRQLAGIKSPRVALDLRPGDVGDPQAGAIHVDQTISIPRNSSIAYVLEDLSHQSDATWFPWGKHVVIVPKQQQIRMQLEKPMTARFNGVDIARVLDQLSATSGVPFQIEAGAFQRVPPEYRSIQLDLANATVRQVLEDIRGVTGLDYKVNPEGVYIWNQNPSRASPPATATDPVIAIAQGDGGIAVLIRESDAPPDLKAYIAQKKQHEIERMRQRMRDEGFTPPTSQPAVKQ